MNKEEKQDILSNIPTISTKELAQYILKNQLTIAEMMETGELEAAKRIEVLSIVAIEKEIEEANEKNEWVLVKSSTDIIKIGDFIKKYPEGKYFRDACDLLELVKNKQQDKIKILNDIKENSNRYTPDRILDYLEKNIITKEDLININIPEVVIDNLKEQKKKLELGNTPEEIEKGVTEVYFWGLPGSGKTCALSAILSVGVKSGEIITKEGTGLHYMSQMSNIFLSNFGVLPERTPLEKTQYLPFDLNDNKGIDHPIALIELSGEIFRAFYLKAAGLEIPTKLQDVYDRVISFLNSNNKKIHFFIIDVTRDPLKPDNDGITQQQYLRAMESFLDKTKIFKNTTDGVYIITTKSDKLSEIPSERKELAKQHLKSEYNSFIESLKRSLKNNKLSKELDLIPFSLGDVYFNDLCHFDNTNSVEIINLLKEKTSKKVSKGFLRSINNFFNS